MITGGIDFTNWFVSLDGTHYDTLAAAQEAGASTLNYGVFITAVINFLLIALVLFLIIKAINSAKKAGDKLVGKEKKPEEPTEKDCPYCLSKIPIKATRCPHCTSEIK
jgi:large conductance mechanosensitive channel